MLHVYAFKIAITATMPKGEIGPLVLAFGIVGTVTYMAGYPWGKAGLRSVRWLVRYWFWLMVIPTGLLLIAVFERVAQYGLTPERYYLALFALWLAGIVVYQGASRGRLDLRVIPGTAAIGLLLSTFGPWGATSVSARSQVRQLRELLTEQHLLEGDRLKLTPPTLETFAQFASSNESIASIVTELSDLSALDRLAPMFSSVTDTPFNKGVAKNELRSLLVTARHPPKDITSQAALALIPEAFNALTVYVKDYDRLVGPIWVDAQGIRVGKADSPALSNLRAGGLDFALSQSGLRVSEGNARMEFTLSTVWTLESEDPAGRFLPTTLDARYGGNGSQLLIVPMPKDKAASRQNDLLEVWLLLRNPSIDPKATIYD